MSTIEKRSVLYHDRLVEIERAKGIGILLVLWGHLVALNSLGEPEWYTRSKGMIYLFHMPFFIYLSGMAFFLSNSHLKTGKAYFRMIWQRANRLLVPFFAFGLLMVIGKYLFSKFAYVTNAPTEISDGIWHMFFETNESSAISIWYIFVLFLYSATTPLVLFVLRYRVALTLLLALPVSIYPLGDNFYLDRASAYLLFFFVGGASALGWPKVKPLILRYWWVFLPAFMFCLLTFDRSEAWHTLVTGMLSIPILMKVSFVSSSSFDFLIWIGERSFIIYLWNTITIGIAKSIYVKLSSFIEIPFWLLLCYLMIAGLFGPLSIGWLYQKIRHRVSSSPRPVK